MKKNYKLLLYMIINRKNLNSIINYNIKKNIKKKWKKIPNLKTINFHNSFF